jgi:hypothetical protein
MDDNFTMDDFDTNDDIENDVESSITEATPAESIKDEAPVADEIKDDETAKPDDVAAESDAYTPDFGYKIKDEDKEFPEFLKGAITSKEQEDQLRDYFTKADALDGIKESRTAIETEYNTYKQGFETNVAPVLTKIGEFDQAVSTGNFNKAWELADQKPSEMVDYMLMDKALSPMVYEKVLGMLDLEQQGPQAVAEKQAHYQETQKVTQLESQNKNLEAQFHDMQVNQYNDAINFGMSQNQVAVAQYDTVQGAGAFEQFVRNYGNMQYQQGNQIAPNQAINEVLGMLNLAAPATNTPVIPSTTTMAMPTIAQPKVAPATIPNLGTGSNTSVVGTAATNWDDWEKNMSAS